jgi:hypothetical protein
VKIFISNRTIDLEEVDNLIANISGYEFLSHRILEASEEAWKSIVKQKMQSSEYVVFFIGKTSNESKPINWEYLEAKRLKKKCFVIKLKNANVPKYIKEEIIIENDLGKIKVIFQNLQLQSPDDLLLEQYKIMVSSTEKVTERRSAVNNLFFTVTTSLLSISTLVGKLIGFENKKTSMLAVGIMLFFAIVSIIITFFWQKLVTSYGKLNKGKFLLINEIEARLKVNLFQREWEILQNEIRYNSNTETESRIIFWFRVFIVIIITIELIYLINLQFNLI